MHTPSLFVAAGGPNGPLLPELRTMFPNAPLIPRAGEINAWDSTEFVNAVKVSSMRNYVVSGVVWAAGLHKNAAASYCGCPWLFSDAQLRLLPFSQQ